MLLFEFILYRSGTGTAKEAFSYSGIGISLQRNRCNFPRE